MPTRREDMGGKRIMLSSHFLNGSLHLANRRRKRLERIVQATGVHYVQSNISPSIGQLRLPDRQPEQLGIERNLGRIRHLPACEQTD
jgi:hypothetical protein